jgi:hypothetical protein
MSLQQLLHRLAPAWDPAHSRTTDLARIEPEHSGDDAREFVGGMQISFASAEPSVLRMFVFVQFSTECLLNRVDRAAYQQAALGYALVHHLKRIGFGPVGRSL